MKPAAGGCLLVLIFGLLGIGLVGKCSESPDRFSYPGFAPSTECTSADRRELLMLQVMEADTVVGGETVTQSMRSRIVKLRGKCG